MTKYILGINLIGSANSFPEPEVWTRLVREEFDLDGGKKHLKVQRQLQRIQGKGMVFTEPKTASGKRMIVLSTGMIAKLREHLNYQQVERVSAENKWQENDLLFPSTLGTPMDPSNMYKDFKDTLKKAELPDIRFHDLRQLLLSCYNRVHIQRSCRNVLGTQT